MRAKKQKEFYRRFYKFLREHNKPSQLRKNSSKQLAGFHQEFERRYKEIYSHYFPILSIENYFFQYLRDYINSLEKDNKQAAHDIDILITERKAMINRQERVAALKTCVIIKENQKWFNVFKCKDFEKLRIKVNQDKKLYNMIKKHEKDFFWITRDYDDPVLSFDDFIKRFQEHLKKDPELELNKIEKEDLKLAQDIRGIYRKLKIDKKHQRLFQTLREGIYYKELRKWIVSKSLYYYDPILSEIGRRGGLSMRQARFLKTSDVKDMLLKNKDMSLEVNQRIKLSVWHTVKGKASVFTGRTAQEYYNYLVEVDPKAKVLQCEAVSAGVARGPVKIVINPDAFHKVKKGDIIATLQATPVFSHVLELASGLICDGGPGITSHPATLAREAGIPGVIKARMATKIFKDGEMVEVDGNTGMVKRLS